MKYFKLFLGTIAVGILLWEFYSYFDMNDEKVVVASVPTAYEPLVVENNSSEIIEFLPQSSGEIVRHLYFILSFNPQHKQANWVYYQPRVEGGIAVRTNNFREDKMVSSGSAKPSDYLKSGYDRGHLCPAGDMTQSIEAMSETFYMSNMSPQIPAFNRGIWKSLEEQVRKWGEKEQIYVVTGPVFKDRKGYIGENKVTVPGYYYKVVYSPSRGQMIGFVLPNEKSYRKFADHIVSVDSVENLTGIDFFPQLPDSLENRLESWSDYSKW